MLGSAGSAKGQGQRWRLPKATARCGSAMCTQAGTSPPLTWPQTAYRQEFILEVWALSYQRQEMEKMKEKGLARISLLMFK